MVTDHCACWDAARAASVACRAPANAVLTGLARPA